MFYVLRIGAAEGEYSVHNKFTGSQPSFNCARAAKCQNVVTMVGVQEVETS